MVNTDIYTTVSVHKELKDPDSRAEGAPSLVESAIGQIYYRERATSNIKIPLINFLLKCVNFMHRATSIE